MEDAQLLPPSYGSLFNDHSSGLSYIDFLPLPTKEGLFSSPECARFGNVVDCANEWLRHNPQWEIKTCESVEFKDEFGIQPSKMLIYKSSKHRQIYIRGLRLWLKIFPLGMERVQQIGYINLVPEARIPDGMFSNAVYETLDDVLLKFNNASRISPLPGRIITVETQEMKLKGGGFDPDRSRWTEFGPVYTRFITIIRIFFEFCDPLYEEIGLEDFIPSILGSKCCGLSSKWETFSSLVEKASLCCSRQPNLRICNIQSLLIRFQTGVNNRTMNYEWSWSDTSSRLRILRVAHIRLQASDCVSPNQFSCKTFFPMLKEQGGLFNCFQPRFESLQDTMQRVSKWIERNNADVLNMETSEVHLQKKGAYYSSEKNDFREMGPAQYYIFVIRAYLKSSYNQSFEDTISEPYANMWSLAIFIVILMILMFFPLFYVFWLKKFF